MRAIATATATGRRMRQRPGLRNLAAAWPCPAAWTCPALIEPPPRSPRRASGRVHAAAWRDELRAVSPCVETALFVFCRGFDGEPGPRSLSSVKKAVGVLRRVWERRGTRYAGPREPPREGRTKPGARPRGAGGGGRPRPEWH